MAGRARLPVVAAACLVAVLSLSCAPVGGPPSGERPDGAPPRSERAVVIRIVDGDTMWLRSDDDGLVSSDHTKVRLLEVDTPETVAPGQPVECYGAEAAEALAELAPVGSDVWVLPDRDLIDPYDRMLLYVWNDDGEFVNLELVRTGAAQAVLYEPNDRHIDQLRAAERRARASSRGMWGSC